MPNWCEGNVRIRGKRKDIEDFLKNELVYTFPTEEKGEDGLPKFGWKEEHPVIKEDKWETYLEPVNDKCHDFWVRGTRRNFFFAESLTIYWPDGDEDCETTVLLEDFNAAWNFKSDGWVDHAQKYNIDIKLFGFEQGCQFHQILTIYKDGSTEEDVITYDDWMWDCPCPNMGG